MSVLPLAPILGGTLLTHLSGPCATLTLTAATAATALIPTLSSAIRTIPRPTAWAAQTASPPIARTSE